MNAHAFSVRHSRPTDTDTLYSVWRRSVEATHEFVAPADLEAMAEIVRTRYLPVTTFMVAVDATDTPIAFMGGDDDTIDSLFVDPDWHRRGVGRALVDLAIERAPVIRLDVNEQNDGARAFYRRMGFAEVGRSEDDEDGFPYPLLHLERRRA